MAENTEKDMELIDPKVVAQLAAQPPLAGAAVCTGDRRQRADVRRLPRTAAAHARGLLRTQQLHAAGAGAGGRAQGVQRTSQPRVPPVVAAMVLPLRGGGLCMYPTPTSSPSP